MASEPKRPNEADNVVSLREARARQAAQAQAAERTKSASGAPEKKKVPALLIFLGLLAVVVAFKFLAG